MSGGSPFDAWFASWRGATALATAGWRVAETMIASAEVIGHRSGAIGAALRDPWSADHPELQRMVSEKMEAFARAGLIATRDVQTLQTVWLATWWQLATLATAGRAPTPAQVTALWSRSADLLGCSARAGTAALDPIHRSATANARRLRR